MPASRPALPSETPAACLQSDNAGVSEVIGYVLIFAIVSMLLIGSMLAFNIAQDAARARVIGLRAESAATRVAGVVVQVAIVQERQATTPGAQALVSFLVDLPDQLEGQTYKVALEPPVPAGCTAACTQAGRVHVTAPATKTDVTAALFSADAPTGIDVCSPATSVTGGALYVHYGPNAACGAGSFIFIASTP